MNPPLKGPDMWSGASVASVASCVLLAAFLAGLSLYALWKTEYRAAECSGVGAGMMAVLAMAHLRIIRQTRSGPPQAGPGRR